MLTRNGEHRCRHRVSARLPRLVQSCSHGQQGPGRRDRRLDAEHADRRLHLREGQEVRRPRVRRRAAAISRRAHRTERTGTVPPRRLGRSDRAHRHPHARGARALGRRSHPPVFVRRIEWPADAGHARRRALPPVRHIAARAHGVRRADRRRRAGALRQDAIGHLRGLSGREADRSLGREPLDVRHPSRAVRARGAEIGRAAGRHRPALDAARAAGRSPPGAAGPAPMSRSRSPSIAISSRKGSRTRSFSPSTRRAPNDCARARRRGRSSAPQTSPACPKRRCGSWPRTTRAPRRR